VSLFAIALVGLLVGVVGQAQHHTEGGVALASQTADFSKETNVSSASRIIAIEPVTSLTTEEKELLTTAVGKHPDLQGRDLAVYRLESSEPKEQTQETLVAPIAPGVKPGMRIVATNGVGALFSVAIGTGEAPSKTRLDIAYKIVAIGE